MTQSNEPKRIQRKRTKGWKMPDGAVYVGRPTRWGNPFPVGPAVGYSVAAGRGASMNHQPSVAVRLYREWLDGEIFDCVVHEHDALGMAIPRRVVQLPPAPETIRAELAGKDLACWCPLDQPCHADVLLSVANGELR